MRYKIEVEVPDDIGIVNDLLEEIYAVLYLWRATLSRDERSVKVFEQTDEENAEWNEREEDADSYIDINDNVFYKERGA